MIFCGTNGTDRTNGTNEIDGVVLWGKMKGAATAIAVLHLFCLLVRFEALGLAFVGIIQPCLRYQAR